MKKENSKSYFIKSDYFFIYKANDFGSDELDDSDKRDLLEAQNLGKNSRKGEYFKFLYARSLKKGFNAWAGKRSNGDTPENLKIYKFMAKNGLLEPSSD